jgi:hypothetical protein
VLASTGAWAFAIWVAYPLLKPHTDRVGRIARGQAFAAYAATAAIGVTGTHAAIRFDNVDRWIAVALVPPIVWLFAFAVGWLAGPMKTAIRRSVSNRKDDEDEALYEQIGAELRSNDTVLATWTRAMAETGGDENAGRAVYIKLRLHKLRSASQTESDTSTAPKSSFSPLDLSWCATAKPAQADVESPRVDGGTCLMTPR